MDRKLLCADKNEMMQNTSHHRRSYLEQYLKQAMACEFELLLNLHQYPSAASVALEAMATIDELESQLSIYRDDSEVSRINREAVNRAVEVECSLFELLQRAIAISSATSGAFSVACGQLVSAWKSSRVAGRVPRPEELQPLINRNCGADFELDSARSSIRFLQPRVQLDLGAIGKGFAIDCVAGSVLQAGISDFLFHAGQSSVIAHGQCLGDSDAAIGWRVGISHPTLDRTRLATIELRDQALATSGNGRQGYFHGGKRYGHILDPRTGLPAERWLSATVVAPTATLADALSTAFFVMESNEIDQYCQANQDIAAFMAATNVEAGSIGLHVFGGDRVLWTPTDQEQ